MKTEKEEKANGKGRFPRSERLPVIMLIAAAGGLCGCYGTIAFGTFAFGETGNLLHLWSDLISGNAQVIKYLSHRLSQGIRRKIGNDLIIQFPDACKQQRPS